MKLLHYSETAQHFIIVKRGISLQHSKAQECDAIFGSLEITGLHAYRNHNPRADIYISRDCLVTRTAQLQAILHMLYLG